MVDAPPPFVVELHGLDDIKIHRAALLAEMHAGRRVTVMARHDDALSFVFRSFPSGNEVVLIAPDLSSTGRFASADRALRVGLRQAERLLSGKFE